MGIENEYAISYAFKKELWIDEKQMNFFRTLKTLFGAEMD